MAIKTVLCDNLEGWDGEGCSKGRGHMYTYGWFMLMYGRNHHNIVIILQLKIKKIVTKSPYLLDNCTAIKCSEVDVS